MVNPYEQYDSYSEGEDWDYNDEMQKLFEDRFAKEEISKRPNSSDAPDNAIFEATDQNLIYRNDATNGWVVIGFGTATDEVPEAYFKDASVSASLTVNSAPSNSNEVTRKEELDSHTGTTQDAHGADGAVQGSNDVDNKIITHTSDDNAHHSKNHASRHHDGGADEIDASDLSGSSGVDGQVLNTNGSGTFWGSPDSQYVPGYKTVEGDIIRSTDGNEDGFVAAGTYQIDSGVTRTVTSGTLVVYASDKIQIDGTLEGIGGGASGGTGGGFGSSSFPNNHEDGNAGNDGDYSGSGGSGGDANSGGSGGQGGIDSSTVNTRNQILIMSSVEWNENILTMSALPGSGGGGGGGGQGDSDGYNGGEGGDGGDGGPIIILISPTVEINGIVRANGQSGQDGNPPEGGTATGGGGGGGGSGGVLSILTDNLIDSNGTKEANGGLGGAGGGDSSPGSDGATGRIIEVIGE